MPRCTNCNYKWNVKDIIALGFSKKGKDCPNCGDRQYISAESQRLLTLGWLSLIFVPFIISKIKLSGKDEPLW
ncbi:hypothetical protein HF394_05265 [Planococcus glaciei]|uniref:CXXC-20-CXXC protein n=1 Tax=Planococcus glaciei TaxID=459472 RepID=A0A7H8Q850_9BACL|nr:TIGR04104 family putative zinc finger protein [Planococcus glaciei]QDY45154.1 hypothetical protein FK545_05625 [Planococcus glaciei]QKX50040.1 hypothetical protein HF394_05265 [Planococcus glaciei]